MEYCYDVKIIFVGPTESGKTSIISHFSDGKFSEANKTIGVDFCLANKESKKIQFWDCSGQEKFKSLTGSYYGSSNVLVFISI
jgi:GTPase SAR1 family protein